MEAPIEDDAEVESRKGEEESKKRGWREGLNGAPCAEKPATATAIAIAPAALPSLLQPAQHHAGAAAADNEAERGTSGKDADGEGGGLKSPKTPKERVAERREGTPPYFPGYKDTTCLLSIFVLY